jgi:primary-amine oxidase
MTIVPQSLPAAAHPLEPLTADEVSRAVRILRSECHLGDAMRFVVVTLHEPAKETVLSFRPGDPVEREAFAVLLDKNTNKTYEALVSLTSGRVTSWEYIPDVQPAIMLDEFFECEAAVKASPEWQAAMRKRGIEDFALAMVDPWSAGNLHIEDEQGRRLSRALTWMRSDPNDNGYARPIENLIAVVDLSRNEVIRVEDDGVVPLPPQAANYSPQVAGERTDLRPLEIRQPDGPSFTINGHAVCWQKWRFRIGFTPREGLVLHTVSYEDQGRERPILYRASVCDMVVPYGDPRSHYSRRCAFDIGEYGVGQLANSLALGCDCLGDIRYFDGVMTDSRGHVTTLAHVVCMHEEDYGILWKHFDWRTNYTEVRRSRRLVVSFIATVANYEYGFFWYFYQDGTIQFEVKLTGIISNGATMPGEPAARWGELVAPQVYGPIHQHFFNVRLDMMVDGPHNSVYEVETVTDPRGPENPLGNAFHLEQRLLSQESAAARLVNPLAARYWKITNPAVRNGVGNPVAYKLMPGDNVTFFPHPASPAAQRAGFATRHFWVTRYHPRERYAGGDYPNQHPGGAGLGAVGVI